MSDQSQSRTQRLLWVPKAVVAAFAMVLLVLVVELYETGMMVVELFRNE